MARDWVNQLAKMNEGIATKNRLTMDGGKTRLVCHFRMQELWKYIGRVLSTVTYGKK